MPGTQRGAAGERARRRAAFVPSGRRSGGALNASPALWDLLCPSLEARGILSHLPSLPAQRRCRVRGGMLLETRPGSGRSTGRAGTSGTSCPCQLCQPRTGLVLFLIGDSAEFKKKNPVGVLCVSCAWLPVMCKLAKGFFLLLQMNSSPPKTRS